jgi:hypothetical protein
MTLIIPKIHFQNRVFLETSWENKKAMGKKFGNP